MSTHPREGSPMWRTPVGAHLDTPTIGAKP